MPSMLLSVDSLLDPRLAPYRNLKDKELARDGRRFIAEGEQVVRRLLASTLQTESVLVAERKVAAIAPLTPPDVPVFSATDATIEQVIGFEFHSGVLACGIRPVNPTLEEVLGPAHAVSDPASTLLVCPKITNLDNIGSLVRLAAGFGVRAMLLGRECCDPFFRHSVRISMGAVFKLPMVRCEDLIADLRRLRADWGYELIATVLAADAEPLAKASRCGNVAILVGGEAEGLSREEIALCDRRVTIPMRHGTDSLNVAVATGIFLHHFIDFSSR
ncbi:MAG: RNA methyltransferase [Tepidisphaeraceae bacterium]